MGVLTIKKLTYKKIFDKLDLDIKKGSNITILGSSGSGKSLLVSLINRGYKKKIKVTGNLVSVNSKVNEQIVGKNVLEQLKFHMELNHYSERKISNRIKKITSYFDIDDLLDKDPFYLSMGEKQLVILLSYLVLDMDIIVFDSAFGYLDKRLKNKVFEYINGIKKLTIINFSSNPSDALLSKEVAIINKNIVYREAIECAFNSDKLYYSNGIDLPFMGELCLKLKYYDIVDKTILDMDELVNEIWK